MGKTGMDRATAGRLRNLHPLYTTVSGAVLWELFLELGYCDEECGSLLDSHVGAMHNILDIMLALESGEAVGYVYTAEDSTRLCENCKALVGKKVITGAFTSLPPFAVGCPLSCKPLAQDDLTLERADIAAVRYGFCCDTFASQQ